MSAPIRPYKGGTRRLRVASGSGSAAASDPMFPERAKSTMGWVHNFDSVHGLGYSIPSSVSVATTAWPAANRAIATPFVTGPTTVSVASIRIWIGTQNGNYDVGIYDSTYTKLTSLGSTACPASGFANADVGDITLAADSLFYIAVVFDGTTATFGSLNLYATINSGHVARCAGVVEMESALPLPTTFVPEIPETNYVPAVILRSV